MREGLFQFFKPSEPRFIDSYTGHSACTLA